MGSRKIRPSLLAGLWLEFADVKWESGPGEHRIDWVDHAEDVAFGMRPIIRLARKTAGRLRELRNRTNILYSGVGPVASGGGLSLISHRPTCLRI